MKLGIILSNGYRLLSVAALLDVFESVNRFYTDDGLVAPFDIELLQYEPVDTHYGTYNGKAPSGKYDIILLPAFSHNAVPGCLPLNMQWIPWLQQQYIQGAALASFCTGAFLLAATGLLDGKPATTHISAEAAFATAFPNVKVQGEAVVTEQDNIYTSGGATNSFHLMMLLIERYCGRDTAVKAAKIYSVDLDRNRQDYFGTFAPVEDHGDDLVKLAQEEIKKKFDKANTIEEIITNVPSSRRNLVRRFKNVTGLTPIEYLQKTRIEKAKQLLEQSSLPIAEVMMGSGYNDLKTFRLVFKKNVGITPKHYREKFSRQIT